MIFSVVSVCWNDLEGLQRTYASLQEQTSRSYEWLVMDGGSSDGAAEWLASEIGTSASWVSEPDRGLYDAMNKGIDRARGDYLIFLNSGDALASTDVFQRVADRIGEMDSLPDFVYGDSIDVTLKQNVHYRVAKSHTTVWRGMFTQHQAMFFRRQCVGTLRYSLEYPLSADYAFICSFLQEAVRRGDRTRKLDFPICRFGLGGMSSVRRKEALREDYRIRKEHLGLPAVASGALWLAHLMHYYVKVHVPGAARAARYARKRPAVDGDR